MNVEPPRPSAAGPSPVSLLPLPPAWSVAMVALGGMVGSALRLGFSALFPAAPGLFPWATFAENVAGAFLLGVVLAMVLERLPPAAGAMRHLRPLMGTGVLGSFTTFSAFSVELAALAEAGQMALAVAYAGLSVSLGLAAALLGMVLGRRRPARQGETA